MAERARNHTKFASQLEDLSDLERVEAARQVAATVESPGWGVIVGLLEGRRARLLDGLVRNELTRDAAEYVAELAEVRGIESALDAAATVLFVGERSAKQLSKVGGAS
jgi:hypothetical protein